MTPHPRQRSFLVAVSATLIAAGCFTAAVTPSARAAALSPAPFLTLRGERDGDQFGAAVAANGDVNADGRDDIVVGAQWNDDDAPNGGRAYVFFGGPGADDAADVWLRPDLVQSRSLTGYAVAIVGDVTGDGVADIAVGAPVSRLAGRVFVYAGGPSLDGIPDRVLAGLKSLEFFGASIAGVGDVNGDGLGDIHVGAPWYVPILSPSTQVGRSYLYFGHPSGGGIVDVVIEARPIGGFRDQLQFGTSVAAAGDANRDGFADLLVGQPADGHFVAGRTFVYYGGSILVHRFPDLQFLIDAFRYRAGRSVALVGDFNADGVDDYVTGAPDSGENGEVTGGRAYLYFGDPEWAEPIRGPNLLFRESSVYDAYGTVVTAGADVSGDGWPDLLVGAPQAEGAAGIRAGRVYVYHGGPSGDTVADVVLEGDRADAAFGSAISLGDVNGDGVADAVIGAPGTLGIPGNPGHVHAFDLVAPLPARAFAHDEHRALPLTEQGAPHCLRVEPVGSSFAIEEVDPGTIRLRAEGQGEISSVAPRAAKRIVGGDRDGNGLAEFEACFEREDLRRLFADVRGRREVLASLTGSLVSGKAFAADVAMIVVGTGPPPAPSVSLSPNPLNPQATLRLRLGEPGPVEIALYDVRGRRIRGVASRAWMPEGEHRFTIDGRDDTGRTLASGVYFYRVVTSRDELRGRFVVAK